MFDLERALSEWRERQARTSSLSPRELDELEDHLRAGLDLELELDAALSPHRAFAIARDELGVGRTLSSEFAKAGNPRCRRLMVAAWAFFVASFLLPVFVSEFQPADGMWPRYGYEVFLRMLAEDEPPAMLLSLGPNLLMVMTLFARSSPVRSSRRWLRRLLAVAGLSLLLIGVCNLFLPASASMDGGPPFQWPATGGAPFLVYLGIGYWAWAGSFGCAAAALWIRDRDWASAEPRRASA